MKKVIAAVAAAGVLVAGAFTASVVAGSGTATAQTEEESTEVAPRGPGSMLSEVLDELVAEGTIDQETADELAAAIEAKVEEKRASGEFGPRGHRHGRGGGELRGLLDDGVISEEELAELPDDHPLNDPEGPAAGYLDGGITEEELDEIREQHRAEREAADTSDA